MRCLHEYEWRFNQVNEMIPMRLMKMAYGANYDATSQSYTYKLYTKGKIVNLMEGNDKPVLSICLNLPSGEPFIGSA
ncbi:hypothetical protein FTZ84_03830 [Salmonella enterica]|nr:hypothetical protein [Salmonella enterica subsp. enterica serovar Rubislaw]EAY8076988.1 hypothetical protein [Salmonella enterica]EBV6048910.1 hypothetical protein [Salmonella enterica subsp. enterica serovar Gaminara]ECG7224253.1 hypothetical protein [Salmonella enterica subsp. enterica serovar Bovismorbificans]EDM6247649.1 hypothetical protein [Salmonella enterica subsp. enterica serovar Muenchen]EDT7230023.1 hypothetical protein [Salmonella enterica subsp. enterica]